MDILKYGNMRLTFRRTDYTTLYINIQLVHKREFIVLQLKRPIDEYVQESLSLFIVRTVRNT